LGENEIDCVLYEAKGERRMLRVESMFFGWCLKVLQNHITVLIKNLKYVGV